MHRRRKAFAGRRLNWRFFAEESGVPAGGGPAAGGTPDSPPAVATVVNADGSFADGWIERAGIDADLKTNKTVVGCKSLGQMARMLVNAESLVGRKGSIIPTDPADTKTADAYFRAVGWPESPEGYPAIEPPADLPEGLEMKPEMFKVFREWSHKARLTASQMKSLAGDILAWNVAQHNAAEGERAQAAEQAKADMRTAWQGKYEQNVQLANTALAAFVDEKDLAEIRQRGMLEDPVFLRLMHKVGEAVSPDRLHARTDGSADGAAIQRQIDDLMTSEAYLNGGQHGRPKDPRHDAVTQQVMQLRNQLHNIR